MRTSDVPKYLIDKYLLEVTRQTVYNWMNIGLHGTKLQYQLVKGKPTARYPNVRVTTEAHVDEFLRTCGIELNVPGSREAGGGSPGTNPGGGA